MPEENHDLFTKRFVPAGWRACRIPGRCRTRRLPSKAFPYDAMPVRENHGNQSRAILAGELHNGCYLEVHQTRLRAGGMPHPPHHHAARGDVPDPRRNAGSDDQRAINAPRPRLRRLRRVRTKNTASATSAQPPPSTLWWRWARTLESQSHRLHRSHCRTLGSSFQQPAIGK